MLFNSLLVTSHLFLKDLFLLRTFLSLLDLLLHLVDKLITLLHLGIKRFLHSLCRIGHTDVTKQENLTSIIPRECNFTIIFSMLFLQNFMFSLQLHISSPKLASLLAQAEGQQK